MEYWDLYDRKGNMLDIKHIRGEPYLDGTYHMVVSNWIINDEGHFLIQKRTKPLGGLPNPWSSIAGAAIMGESSFDAVIRETKEEMGINLQRRDLRFVERTFYDVFFKDVYESIWNGRIDEVNFDPIEVADVKWVTAEELCEMYEKKEFFDNRSDYFDMILNRVRI